MAKKILLALSGGVDSSVAAYLLKKQGLELSAVYIKFYIHNKKQKKIIDQESQIAEKIAQSLKIPFTILDCSLKQKKLVIDSLLSSYQQGDTPNPCIICNKLIKFGYLLDWANKKGFSHLASGHYAQIIEKADGLHLASAKDKTKDQSYFLYQLKEKQLAKILFPIGSLKKSVVKKIAKEANLKHFNRESFDMCFLKDSNFKKFLSNNLQHNPGDIVDQQGLVIGKHQGLAFYTIGQRRGFDIDHRALKKSQIITYPNNQAPPLVVVNKMRDDNQLVVAKPEACFVNEFSIKNLEFVKLNDEQRWKKRKKFSSLVKIRNTGKLISCQVKEKQKQIMVRTKINVFAPARGQAAVFYRQDQSNLLVIGGATIDNGVVRFSSNDLGCQLDVI